MTDDSLDGRISSFVAEVWRLAQEKFPDEKDREEALESIAELMETWVLREDPEAPVVVKIVN